MTSLDWWDARTAYERLAPHYDELTADYDHDTWVARLMALAQPTGTRVLDVACGTGKSFAPLIGAGYEISACDIAPAMVSRARQRFDPGPRRLFAADMRALPSSGTFDLITCLDDAVNYLLTPAELRAAFRAVEHLLDPGGTFIFDANTLRTYRTAFATSHDLGSGAERFRWRGLRRTPASAGSEAVALVERVSAGCAEVIASHRQRHYPVAELVALLDAANLTVDAVVGQSTGCRLQRGDDELRTTKTVFVARTRSWQDRQRRCP